MVELCEVRTLSMDEFLEIEDEDLKKYIYVHHLANLHSGEIVKVDNEEKLGYYYRAVDVRCNLQGKFYKFSRLVEWIVYDRKTKKVKLSRSHGTCFDRLLKDYFVAPGYINHLVPKASATFCKKVVEGKINTIRDILNYCRSYVVRDKSVNLLGIYKFLMIGKISNLSCVVNPEDILWKNDLEHVPHEYINARLPKFRIEDILNVKERYDEWRSEQSEVYDSFQRQRAADNRSVNAEKCTAY